MGIGRRPGHDLELPGDERVSRDHAELVQEPGDGGSQWALRDTGSKHGTFLNGVRLAPGKAATLRDGDVITISPWTLRFVDTSARSDAPRRVAVSDDGSTFGTIVSPLQAGEEQTLARHRLALLLECAESIHAATQEQMLAERVLDAAVAGAGYSNAAMLRPLSEDGVVEVIASRGDIVEGDDAKLSRSLIQCAAMGEPARLQVGSEIGREAQSVVDLRIDDAICVPIMVASAVAGFLYLDNRGRRTRGSRAATDAAGFAMGLARLAAMALANLRRVDVERRYARLEADLRAGAEAQRWVMPRGEGSFGPVSYNGRSQPGRYVGGDFFDVLPLDGGRVAVALGDVSGKGIAASVLMTASQGFLHAALRQHGDPGLAVTDLNRFIHPRRPEDKFLTLWVGVFDPRAGALRYVDAGHGLALMLRADGDVSPLTGDGLLVGLDPDCAHDAAEVALPPGGRALILSDGIVEQPGAAGGGQFGFEGVRACVAGMDAGADVVGALFDAVVAHAGTKSLADDATAVVVRW